MKVLGALLLVIFAVSGVVSSVEPFVQQAIEDCFKRKFSHANQLKPDEVGYYFLNFMRLVSQSVRHMKDRHVELTEAELEKICDANIPEAHPASYESLVKAINSKASTWVAETSPRFKELSRKDARKLMGTIMGKAAIRLPAKHRVLGDAHDKKDDPIPESFDARQKWPECPSIGHIRDQANCGSCWAFASTEAYNDRTCIASKGKFQQLLSVQHTASCCGPNQCSSYGCDGGQPGAAWDWFTNFGVVTGGDYSDIGKETSCWPYQLPMCSHHVESQYPACSGETTAPQCRKTCSEDKYAGKFDHDRRRASSAFSLDGREQIKRDLMTNGPVTAAFTVFEDFPNYKSGVYQHLTGNNLGGHAIKIIGWGKENNVEYWLVVNSWNDTWGDKGLFKIKMGDCGIDDMVTAGLVTFDPANTTPGPAPTDDPADNTTTDPDGPSDAPGAYEAAEIVA